MPMTDSSKRQSRLTGYIPGKLYEELDHHGHPFEMEDEPEDVKIVSEIASRLLDLRDEDRKKPFRLLNQFMRLYRVSPSCLWLALEILSSNRLGGKSLSDLGGEIGCSKQAVHQQQNRDLEALARIMPGVADQMSRTLGRHARLATTPAPTAETSEES